MLPSSEPVAAPRLSPLQRDALALLARDNDPSDNVVHSGADCFWDSGAWIGFRTARALARQGLASTHFEADDDYGYIDITDAGRAYLAARQPASTAHTEVRDV